MMDTLLNNEHDETHKPCSHSGATDRHIHVDRQRGDVPKSNSSYSEVLKSYRSVSISRSIFCTIEIIPFVKKKIVKR
jgi:hypothetical protein